MSDPDQNNNINNQNYDNSPNQEKTSQEEQTQSQNIPENTKEQLNDNPTQLLMNSPLH